MLESKTVSINGASYRIQQLGSYKARAVARLLMNEAGRALKAAGASGVGMDEEAQRMIAVGLGELLADLSEEVTETLTRTFAEVTMVDNGHGMRPLDDTLQDALMGGGKGLSTWLQWLVACVEFSVGDFFREAARLKDRFNPETEAGGVDESKPATSPTTSTGSSTVSRPPISIGRR